MSLAHFFLTDLEMRIVPPYIPWPRATVLRLPVQEALLILIVWSCM
jgi:uncharacterized membrane protein